MFAVNGMESSSCFERNVLSTMNSCIYLNQYLLNIFSCSKNPHSRNGAAELPEWFIVAKEQ